MKRLLPLFVISNFVLAKASGTDTTSLDVLHQHKINLFSLASETEHKMEAVGSYTTGAINHTWRNADAGGYFMYSLKSSGSAEYVYLSFISSRSDTAQVDIYANGKLLQTIHDINTNNTEKAYAIKLPAALTTGEKVVTIKLQAYRKQYTGYLYDLRLIKDNFKEAIVFE